MAGINPNLVGNNLKLQQTQVKKVAAQEENNQQQTQQAETQAVKQPAVPTLQQPTVKVPLENLQLLSGVNMPGKVGKPTKLAHYEYTDLNDINKDWKKFKDMDTVTLKRPGGTYEGTFVYMDAGRIGLLLTDEEGHTSFHVLPYEPI